MGVLAGSNAREACNASSQSTTRVGSDQRCLGPRSTNSERGQTTRAALLHVMWQREIRDEQRQAQ